MSPKILFVYTSASKNLKDGPTGWFLPEAAHPYYKLISHVEIDFAAPAGPNPPVDEQSVKTFKDDEESVKFLKDPEVVSKLQTAKKLTEINVDEYDGVFYIGGHGPAIDLPTDVNNIGLANKFWAANKVVSAVCHGPAALVGVTDSNGKSIFAGRNATGFSNAEEKILDGVELIPFLLEDRIKELGGQFEVAEKPFGPKVVVDGNLITGQNPASAGPIGDAILKSLGL
ncbi:hypothetical protein M422DRAFT_40431 [Sphaerobolus stellatus SS14]|nr:hypothetical protein M422DRAFT_40431 [Sphaerobolus stellatus SS14]